MVRQSNPHALSIFAAAKTLPTGRQAVWQRSTCAFRCYMSAKRIAVMGLEDDLTE